MVLGVALARRRALLGGGRALGVRPRSLRLAPALRRRGVALLLAAARAALLAAAAFLVDGRPGAPLGFLVGNAALLVALGDVVGLALLLVGVLRFVAARHREPPVLVVRTMNANPRISLWFRSLAEPPTPWRVVKALQPRDRHA